MKVALWRVYYHSIEEKDGKEVSHSSPIDVMVAAETSAQLLAALPAPEQKPGTVTRNVIDQIDQKHKAVLLAPTKG